MADSAHRKKDFAAAAAYWEAALALNPLHASGWFALGHSFLKVDKLDKAVHVTSPPSQLLHPALRCAMLQCPSNY